MLLATENSVVAVALSAIDPNTGKPLKLFSPSLRAAFYTLLLTSWLKLLASHCALQAGPNKLILDEEIPKLDQPMSDRGPLATVLT